MRWLLEQYEFPMENVSDVGVRTGALDALDVVVFGDEEADEILNGHKPGSDARSLRRRARVRGRDAGQTLRRAGRLARRDRPRGRLRDRGVPPARRERGEGPEAARSSSSRARCCACQFDRAHPLAFGMPAEGIALFSRSRYWRCVPAGSEGVDRLARDVEVFATYAAETLSPAAGHSAPTSISPASPPPSISPTARDTSCCWPSVRISAGSRTTHTSCSSIPSFFRPWTGARGQRQRGAGVSPV